MPQAIDEETQLLKALANAKRLRILSFLRQNERCVSEIAEALNLRQSNVSQHLTILDSVGLLQSCRKGKYIYYHLSNQKIGNIPAIINEVLGQYTKI